MEKEIIITVQGLNKQFKDHHVLKDINAEFKGGKIYGIVGRNGSGKSVLMKCICGFMPPTSGTVKVNGKIVGKEVDFPEEIGFIIETPGFLKNYSGFKNLKYLASIRNKIGPDEIRHYLQLVGLDPDEKKHVGKYSLGMCQRLGIAQALMEEPQILLLDEPMNGLDQEGVQDMRKLFLEQKQKGRLILLATHVREDVELLCDEVYEMKNGRLEVQSYNQEQVQIGNFAQYKSALQQ